MELNDTFKKKNKIAYIILALILFCIPLSVFASDSDAQADYTKVTAHIEKEEYEKAVILLDQYREQGDSSSEESDYYYGVCYNRMGLYKLAHKYTLRYLNVNPDTKGEYERAIYLYGNDNYPKAIRQFEEIEEDYQDSGEFHYYYGMSYYNNGDYKDSVKELEEAVALVPEDYTYITDLWNAYDYTEEYEKGIKSCNTYLKYLEEQKKPDTESIDIVKSYRADFYCSAGDYQTAMDYYKAELEDSKDPAYEYYRIAACYAGMDDFENTFKYLKKCYEEDNYTYEDEYKWDEAFYEFFEDETYKEKMDIVEID